jgi:hypothetical protein
MLESPANLNLLDVLAAAAGNEERKLKRDKEKSQCLATAL